MSKFRTAEVLHFADVHRDPTEARWEPIEFEGLRPGNIFRLREPGSKMVEPRYVSVCTGEPVRVEPDGNWQVSSIPALLGWAPEEDAAAEPPP